MPPTPSTPKIEYRHNVSTGSHEIGVRVGKVFVAIAELPDAAFDSAVARAADTADNDDDDDGNGG